MIKFLKKYEFWVLIILAIAMYLFESLFGIDGLHDVGTVFFLIAIISLSIGYIADEVKDAAGAYAPNLVGSEPKDGYLTLDYSRMNCILWEVVKGLQARITALEAKGTRKKPA